MLTSRVVSNRCKTSRVLRVDAAGVAAVKEPRQPLMAKPRYHDDKYNLSGYSVQSGSSAARRHHRDRRASGQKPRASKKRFCGRGRPRFSRFCWRAAPLRRSPAAWISRCAPRNIIAPPCCASSTPSRFRPCCESRWRIMIEQPRFSGCVGNLDNFKPTCLRVVSMHGPHAS